MFSDVSISYLTIKVCPVKYLLLRPEGASACCKIETKNNSVESIQVINIVSNRAKGWISKRVFQEKKAREISQKTNIPSLLIGTPTYQGVKNVFFSENLACYVFLKHPFWDPPFYFITDDINDLNACARKTLLRVKNKMRELTPHFKLWLWTADCAPDCWSSKSTLKNPAHLLRVTEKNQFKDWYCFKVVYYQL